MEINHTLRLHVNDLITWIWKNNIKNHKYWSNNGSYVTVENGAITQVYIINERDLFTVEETQSITLDTEIPHFLEKDVYYNYREHQNKSINDLLFLNTTAQIWIINDDMTHTLIWKYGELSNDFGRFETE